MSTERLGSRYLLEERVGEGGYNGDYQSTGHEPGFVTF